MISPQSDFTLSGIPGNLTLLVSSIKSMRETNNQNVAYDYPFCIMQGAVGDTGRTLKVRYMGT